MDLTFVTSALEPESWPKLLDPKGNPLPEIALAGRSNVGKSTFLNLIAGKKATAKVSSTPGKTQRIVFFHAEDRLCVVDLPGYGFAKAPVHLQAEWSRAIDAYLHTRTSLKLLVLLLDIRRSLGPEDLKLLTWAQNASIEVLPVFTKTDMLSKNEYEKCRKKALSELTPHLPSQTIDILNVPAPSRIIWTILTKKIYATL
jgi:GTP-binding protein